MLDITRSFGEICENYDYAVIDTSSFGRRRFNVLKYMDIKSAYYFPYALPMAEEIVFLNELIESVKGRENVKTVEKVIGEIDKGLRKMKSRKKRDYKSTITGIRRILQSRIVETMLEEGTEEMKNLDLLYDNLEFLKREHGLSDTDLSLVVNSVNLATYRGDTAMISNDKEILDVIFQAEDKIFRIESVKPPKYKLAPYTSMDKNHFYLYTQQTENKDNGKPVFA